MLDLVRESPQLVSLSRQLLQGLWIMSRAIVLYHRRMKSPWPEFSELPMKNKVCRANLALKAHVSLLWYRSSKSGSYHKFLVVISAKGRRGQRHSPKAKNHRLKTIMPVVSTHGVSESRLSLAVKMVILTS